jgi:hypothetical protein
MPLESEAIAAMTSALRRFEAAVDAPQKMPHKGSFVHRYANNGLLEALVQKMARNISGLNAVGVLLTAGYVQEVGILFRALDETHEDIAFLATAETSGAYTERHKKFLDAFYAEAVFSRLEGSVDIPKPDLLPRKKVRAHTMNTLGKGLNVSQALSASESISTAYSGYVHGASENIMDLYGGYPPHFHVAGMRDTPRIATFAADAQNYFYRGLMTTIMCAKAFGDRALVNDLCAFLAKYEEANGHKPRGA